MLQISGKFGLTVLTRGIWDAAEEYYEEVYSEENFRKLPSDPEARFLVAPDVQVSTGKARSTVQMS